MTIKDGIKLAIGQLIVHVILAVIGGAVIVGLGLSSILLRM